MVGFDRFNHLGGKLDLGSVLGDSNELFEREHAVGDGNGLDASCFFDRHIHVVLPRFSYFVKR